MSISDGSVRRPRHPWRALAVLVLCGALGAGPSAATVLKIATLAPEGSSWVRALRDIDADLRAGTGTALSLKIYPGGVQGDEDVILRKIRIGQLQGAGLGGIGVSQVFADVLALEMPFLFADYDEVDYVLEKMGAFYAAGYLQAGYVLLGWSDIGFVYLMSRDPVRGADDIRGMKVWRLQGEPITGVLFQKAGVAAVPLSIPDVLLGLQTNLVDVVYAPPAAAIVLQWFTRVRYYTDLPINYSLGAFVVERQSFEALTPDQQALLRDSAARHMRAHKQRGRRDNEEALAVMRKEGVAAVISPPEQIESFHALVRAATPELVGPAFSRAAHDSVLYHLQTFRRSPSSSGRE